MAKVVIFGGAGRVGQQLAAELTRAGLDIAIVDLIDGKQLGQIAARILNDSCLAVPDCRARLSHHGGVNVLDIDRVSAVLAQEQPELVINYAIPITWDATKRLPNYARLSAAGLGAFTPIQVAAPLVIARAMATRCPQAKLMVGNLPDITIPVINGCAQSEALVRPACGAGNVGLMAAAVHRLAARELMAAPAQLNVKLVAHHVHWVAPREPGYANDAPFLLRVSHEGEDVTSQFGDSRALLNRAINDCYEPGAAFSSTTGILAARNALALLDPSPTVHKLHVPAPLGLPGGYPVRARQGALELDLPPDWKRGDAVEKMALATSRDGVDQVLEDGSVLFADYAQAILKEELGFDLPTLMRAWEIEEVAAAQIACIRAKF
ncbi:hypothetical protein EY643_02735 [Halioglobus maricola]|uniref:Uncharacterized protein n=1 Tax=Halioglobus maricola TaxID=2601894 RepID=A0A5P9NHH1_9GAMM|nr:hypothetical protein [Halioglobus maricola]QFU74654.1 hypothetical protein EY643_02735 [Halioglobus maricola]